MSNNKQIVKNIGFSSLSFGINFLLSFFLTPYLIRTVGKEAYSFFPLVNTMIGYTGILTAMISSMAGRYVTMAYYGSDQNETNGYFNSAIAAYLFFSAILCVLGIFIIVNIGIVLHIPVGLKGQVQILFGLALLGSCISLCTNLFGVGTYVKNRVDLDSKASLAQRITYVFSLFALFTFFFPSIVYISIASFISVLVGMGFKLYFKKRFLPEIVFSPFKYFSWQKIKTLLNSGIWMSINSLSNILTTSIDLLLANIFISAAATGDFSISKTIPGFISSLSVAIFGTFTANFNILYAKKRYAELLHEIRKAMIILSFLVSVPIGFFMINSDFFFQLWVSSAYSPDMTWLSLIALILTATGYSTNPIYGIYTITDKRKIPTIALLAAGAVNVFFMLILLNYTDLGVYAIAISSAISLGVRNLFFTPIYGALCLKLKPTYFYPLLFKSLLGITIVAIIAIMSRFFMVKVTWLSFFIDLVSVCIISYIVNYHFFLKKEERQYIKKVVNSKLSLLYSK